MSPMVRIWHQFWMGWHEAVAAIMDSVAKRNWDRHDRHLLALLVEGEDPEAWAAPEPGSMEEEIAIEIAKSRMPF